MEGDSRFLGKRNRQAFLKKTATQKLHIIAQCKGDLFADKVEIRTDPEVFVEFRRNVMPFVLRGCATNGCHGRPRYPGPVGGEDTHDAGPVLCPLEGIIRETENAATGGVIGDRRGRPRHHTQVWWR